MELDPPQVEEQTKLTPGLIALWHKGCQVRPLWDGMAGVLLTAKGGM
jgi:hypothetical protein